MESRSSQLPVLIYATIVGCVLLLMIWQHSRISAGEQRNLKAETQLVEAQDADFEALERQKATLTGIYAQARTVLKLNYLGLIVFPTAVLFPVIYSTAPRRKSRPKKTVKHVRDLTFDDVDQELPKDAFVQEADPKSRLFLWNAIAFLAPTLVVAGFVLAKPIAYAGLFYGVQTVLLFVVGALLTFSGTVIALSMRERNLETREIAQKCVLGYVVLAGLGWWFL